MYITSDASNFIVNTVLCYYCVYYKFNASDVRYTYYKQTMVEISYTQGRTKFRNCRLTTKNPDYKLGWVTLPTLHVT